MMLMFGHGNRGGGVECGELDRGRIEFSSENIVCVNSLKNILFTQPVVDMVLLFPH
jgi:hypothetical protein